MTRHTLSLITLATFAAAASLRAEPPPNAKRAANKVDSQKSQASTNAASVEGWTYVKGEWLHSDGYKYVNGRVIRVGTQTHKRPPKPPSKSLLNSVLVKPAPTPVPGSAEAKAAEKERNLTPRPASQTGTHL
jgi:hypothetical protein